MNDLEQKVNRQIAAFQVFIETWGDGYLAGDMADKLTCIEAEAIAELFRAFGETRTAEAWIESHAYGDDCGDMHCQCDDPECIKEREPGCPCGDPRCEKEE
ncbi:hypothetical protein KIY83_gp77 [Mycobacterium phage Fameo]|uniref:Uncharacterized protein n=2 Tax=Turbidovirus TaxID=2948936 RepID=A0A220NSG7_9CAUD|nr:hypothetical protein KIY83_gp77 [Mycobacterium phage Fameo]YP_010063979.1 hypothetical protein KIY85_gp76 [Mycobacterium phage Heffalump]ASJ79763.1 hypothetical protein SEA_HEFFALUMP_76 [Mycobacterium phage Heffalump]AVR76846.1 hypothetical protein SEA_FAMEO_77 [Mycobacterium phage Fameo]QGJ89025.1 hypothetical protein SEA_QUEENB2_76 [Mycobacterium phage QueenB2]